MELRCRLEAAEIGLEQLRSNGLVPPDEDWLKRVPAKRFKRAKESALDFSSILGAIPSYPASDLLRRPFGRNTAAEWSLACQPVLLLSC